jgi:PTS system nitrogen regulatory IIA component
MDPRLVQIGADVSTLDEAIELALKNVTELYRHEVDYEDALKRISERQSLGGTTFDSGIAIPHARIPDFKDFIIAVVVPKKPVCLEATPCDEEKFVRIVFLVLLSQTASSIYLNTLSKLMVASQDEAVMGALLKAESPSHFVDVFEKKGYEVKKDLLVTDVMTREVVSIRNDATVKELTDLMFSKRLRYIPVVDADGRLAGEIGILDLIKAGIPDYAFRIGSLKFLAELEPMTELLLNEEKILVESIMQKPPAPIDSTTSVVEAAFEMARSRKRHFAVMEGGKLVGVISSMDILNKVLRA